MAASRRLLGGRSLVASSSSLASFAASPDGPVSSRRPASYLSAAFSGENVSPSMLDKKRRMQSVQPFASRASLRPPSSSKSVSGERENRRRAAADGEEETRVGLAASLRRDTDRRGEKKTREREGRGGDPTEARKSLQKGSKQNPQVVPLRERLTKERTGGGVAETRRRGSVSAPAAAPEETGGDRGDSSHSLAREERGDRGEGGQSEAGREEVREEPKNRGGRWRQRSSGGGREEGAPEAGEREGRSARERRRREGEDAHSDRERTERLSPRRSDSRGEEGDAEEEERVTRRRRTVIREATKTAKEGFLLSRDSLMSKVTESGYEVSPGTTCTPLTVEKEFMGGVISLSAGASFGPVNTQEGLTRLFVLACEDGRLQFESGLKGSCARVSQYTELLVAPFSAYALTNRSKTKPARLLLMSNGVEEAEFQPSQLLTEASPE
ncbi:UNVERIFIED_CONTAM: glutamic acid-rcih protein, putative [Hammondia hammondi]|eukprot:XP_008886958.1 glutamic acid-rcih protein, putative [Hammondia hammondi]